MKRFTLLVVVAVLLTGCVMPDFSYLLPAVAPTAAALSSPTVTLAPGETRPPTDTPTLTETPTETPIPPTDTPAFTSTPTQRPTITLPPLNLGAFTPGSPAISSVLISTDTIRWGACGGVGPYEVTFTARVGLIKSLAYVLLFLRLQDKYTYIGTKWFGGAIMHPDKNKAVYTYTISLEQITNYEDFDAAWLQYQIVAADHNQNSLARSQVYQDKISVIHCATPTPRP